MIQDNLLVRVFILRLFLPFSHALLPPILPLFSSGVEQVQLPIIQQVNGNTNCNIEDYNKQLHTTAISPSFLLSSSNENTNVEKVSSLSKITSLTNVRSKGKKDTVVRVVNANTIKLEKLGLISLGAVQTPSGYGASTFPECMSVNPSFKVKQLLPPKTPVYVVLLTEDSSTSSSSNSRALVWRDQELVNAELVRVGMAKPSKRGQAEAEKKLPGISVALQQLQEDAQTKKKGLYTSCEDEKELRRSFDDEQQFEPLEWTLETKFFSDGGKPILRRNDVESETTKPNNPGDIKGCSDFSTYEDALKWFEYYRPWYGDVARLDRDGDGVPCPKLPHTRDQDLYRMKKPDNR